MISKERTYRILYIDCMALYLKDAANLRIVWGNAIKTLAGIYPNCVVQSCIPTGSDRDVYDERLGCWSAQMDVLIFYTEV